MGQERMHIDAMSAVMGAMIMTPKKVRTQGYKRGGTGYDSMNELI